MAATLVLAVSYGAGPTVTDSVAGIDLISADNATNTLANRQANPITVGTNSYEKWVRLKITATPTNYVQSFKVWFNTIVDLSTTLYFTGAWVTYRVATNVASTAATVASTVHTSGNKATWDNTQYLGSQSLNSYTQYLALQLAVGATAGPGNWTQQTVNYSYEEA
jgi:hypothetical protein